MRGMTAARGEKLAAFAQVTGSALLAGPAICKGVGLSPGRCPARLEDPDLEAVTLGERHAPAISPGCSGLAAGNCGRAWDAQI